MEPNIIDSYEIPHFIDSMPEATRAMLVSKDDSEYCLVQCERVEGKDVYTPLIHEGHKEQSFLSLKEAVDLEICMKFSPDFALEIFEESKKFMYPI
jgi:hypothetical protein